MLDRGDAIDALLGGDAAARGGVERSDPKTWNCPFLAEVLPARDIAAACVQSTHRIVKLTQILVELT
mgnify:CR=1 FL=1